MSNFLLLNGPNLNLLGSREPEIYGSTSLADIESQLLKICLEGNHSLDSFQSNAEHDLVNKIHEAKDANVKCIIFNLDNIEVNRIVEFPKESLENDILKIIR